MIWLEFVMSALVIVLAATRLAAYGDIIALRTKLGGMFVGTLLLAGATSLPELLTAINAIDQDVPNLTVGNIFGSSMFNMFILAALDVIYWRTHIMRRLDRGHALSSGLAVGLTGLAVFFILAQIDVSIGRVGLDSLVLIVVYILGTRILFGGGGGSDDPLPEPDIPDDVPSLLHALAGFALATGILIMITPVLVTSSIKIAEETGQSAGFVGIALVAVITSLPEVVTTVQAARIGAYDLAAGNLFGSNIFNIFALGITDLFYANGRFLAQISPEMVLAGIMALLLTHITLMASLVQSLTPRRQRQTVIEVDAWLIVICYILGMILIYNRGLIG
ncbi:MAG: sodium:calcium antiporter [Anaerolineae bacterium]|nr:sodium:calcium antiporter [Anaerolineae bacterium]